MCFILYLISYKCIRLNKVGFDSIVFVCIVFFYLSDWIIDLVIVFSKDSHSGFGTFSLFRWKSRNKILLVALGRGMVA